MLFDNNGHYLCRVNEKQTYYNVRFSITMKDMGNLDVFFTSCLHRLCRETRTFFYKKKTLQKIYLEDLLY